mgnify:CR=1 FL=1
MEGRPEAEGLNPSVVIRSFWGLFKFLAPLNGRRSLNPSVVIRSFWGLWKILKKANRNTLSQSLRGDQVFLGLPRTNGERSYSITVSIPPW